MPVESLEKSYFQHSISKTRTVSSDVQVDIARAEAAFRLNWGVYTDALKSRQLALDIGFGPGSFLEVYRRLGFAHVKGVDRSEDCCSYVRQKINPEADVTVDNAAHFLHQSSDRFDLITAYHVIEHMDHEEGIAFLKEIPQRLSPEGICILETPNMNYPLAPYHFFGDSTHLVGFTPGSLRDRLESCGLRVLAMGEKRNPAGSFVHRIRQFLADITLHGGLNALIFLFEGYQEMKMRQNILSPYFWVVAQKAD